MRDNVFWELYVAWTQGGFDDFYRDRAECFAWLKEGQEDGEESLKDMSSEELKRLAEELCREYEREAKE